MIDVLLKLITALQVASAVAALVTAFKPSVSERTRKAAFGVLTAVSLLATVAHLMSGHAFYGTLLAALTVLLLVTWGQAPRVLVRWVRARKREKSTK
ncbi:hypothetical protein [Streptomyces lydicus]|uniref:hypothetical protein n=1 Tax=Streptomyces lydicus TaxID=47763 RepID=UPI0010111483|nr:hypothetical protein [Streptomyces lydicus]MCZ1012007.1 hypothetical protein [Streptomyces lydicus]